MVAVGFLLLWGGYSTGLWGWCLLRDYDVTFGQLASPFHPYAGTWPPAAIPASQIWPGAQPASAAASTTTGSSPGKGGGGILNDLKNLNPF